jgi:hypothetical protein
MNNVRKFAQGNVGPMRMLGDNLKMQKNLFIPGNMYMFTYSPIHKDTLPFYDKFPLVFPFSMKKGYMTGINLHYVHPKFRLLILDNLLSLRTTNEITSRTQLKMSWAALQRMAQHPHIEKCVKKYHLGHVKSMMLKVDPNDWPLAIFLPLERFEGATANKVWSL